MAEIVRTLNEYEEVYGWKRPSEQTLVGRLLALSRIEIDRFPLRKETLDLVDKEFRQVKFFRKKKHFHRDFFFSLRSSKKFKKLKVNSKHRIDN